MPTVHVTIRWPDGVAPLPGTASARVTVEDVSHLDTGSRVLGETVLRNPSVASPAAVAVAVSAVDPRSDITVRVHVSRSGDHTARPAPGDLLTMQSYPVLTHGHGEDVVVVVRVAD